MTSAPLVGLIFFADFAGSDLCPILRSNATLGGPS
jgi:hypothetical protein